MKCEIICSDIVTSSQTGGGKNFINMLWYCDVTANWRREQLYLYALLLWRHRKMEEGITSVICSDTVTISETGTGNNFIYMLWFCDVIANWGREQLYLYALILWRHRKLEEGTTLFICSDIVTSWQTGGGRNCTHMLWYCDVTAN